MEKREDLEKLFHEWQRREMDAKRKEQKRLQFETIKTLYQNDWAFDDIMKVMRPSMGMGPVRCYYNRIVEGKEFSD